MVLFQGWNTLVGLIGCGLIGAGLEAMTGSRTFGYAVAGLALLGFGYYVNSVLDEDNRLFWIPIQFWGVVVVLGALVGM